MWRKHGLPYLVVTALLGLLAFGSPAFAQTDATPIQIGQNITGTLSAEASSAQFALTAAGGETALIQVLAISPGFAPQLRIHNPAGIEILTLDNAEGSSTISTNVPLNDAGVYTLEVSGAKNTVGQYLLSLLPGTPLPEPIPLTVNQPVTATVGSQTPAQRYRFATTSIGSVAISVLIQGTNEGVLVTLYDETAGKPIASSDAGVVGVSYLLPAVDHVYRVDVSAARAGDTAFSICLGTCGSSDLNASSVSPTATPEQVVATPQLAAATCTVTSNAGGAVNVRSGNGTQYVIVGSLPAGQAFPALGQNSANGVWVQVNVNGTIGWVSASVTRLDGDCSALQSIAAPVNAQLAPTQAPTQAAPPTSSGNQGNPTLTATAMPTQPTPLPDLTISGINISRGTSNQLVANSIILNIGTAPLAQNRTFSIIVCVDGYDNCNEVTGVALPLLPPGVSQNYIVDLPSFTPGGSHTVNVTVDARSEIGELNESNNTAFASFNG